MRRFWTTPLRMTSGSSSGLGALAIWRQRASFWRRSVALVEGGAELLEALVEEGAALLDVDEALLALEGLEAAVGLLRLLALLLDLHAQPLPRLGGGLEAQVEALLDVELGEGVGGGGGELGAAGGDGDVDEAAVADGADGGAARRRRSRPPSPGSGPGGGRGSPPGAAWSRGPPYSGSFRSLRCSMTRRARERLWRSLYWVW
jgi:hypothetical protein